jgi:hypothetical protein
MSVKTEVSDDAVETVDSIYAVVNGIDNDGELWKEAADVINHTASGVSFYLPRACGVGTLISLALTYPPHMRCYDHAHEFYRIWGLVQHCHMATTEDSSAFHVGVGFIGEEAPESYEANSQQNYRVCGMTEDGLWKITEAESKFVQRKELRYWKNVDLYLALVDERRETVGGEWVKTENVSKGGAAVITSLDLNVDDKIKIISEKYDFSALAVVCNLAPWTDGKSRLSLEFVDSEFPVERIKSRRATDT